MVWRKCIFKHIEIPQIPSNTIKYPDASCVKGNLHIVDTDIGSM